jgi:hypothetical protein
MADQLEVGGEIDNSSTTLRNACRTLKRALIRMKNVSTSFIASMSLNDYIRDDMVARDAAHRTRWTTARVDSCRQSGKLCSVHGDAARSELTSRNLEYRVRQASYAVVSQVGCPLCQTDSSSRTMKVMFY